MVSIKWCLKQSLGLKLIESNENVSDSYLKMAKESLNVLNNVKDSKIWTATTAYYIFYYSLYSLMQFIGIKCEIHSCSIEFMKNYLNNFYNQKDLELFEKAFNARKDLQYYTDRPVNESDLNEIDKYSKIFFIKTKEIILTISEDEINQIRNKIKK